jgi:four helix bundle protein
MGKRNKNRGYQKLRVWEDAIEYYVVVCKIYRKLPYELRRVVSQAIASADSVHRNIAEGYCRRSINEYLNFLNYSLASLGESVSGNIACFRALQITEVNFNALDSLSFRLENGLLRLVESLQRKRRDGDWTESLIVKECNEAYNVSINSN